MTKRRGNREGTTVQRPDGRWESKIVLPDGRRHSVYGKTYEESRKKKLKVLRAIEDGLPIPGERLTVGRFLDDWLAGIKLSVRPRTWQRYEEYVRIHLKPTLGRTALTRLSPEVLERFFTEKLEAGLAPRTVGHMRGLMIAALNRAMRRGQVVRNVAALTDRPKVPSTEPRALTIEQVGKLFTAAKGDRLEALYVLAVLLGMRQGELLNLRWRDVDLAGRSLAVTGSLQHTKDGVRVFDPKTQRSRRRLHLPDLVVTALRAHRSRQLEERLRAGDVWHDQDLVFASEIGTPLHPANILRRSFWPLLYKIGLAAKEEQKVTRQRRGKLVEVEVERLRPADGIRFHSLRHTSASLVLQSAVQPAIVSQMLGHARTSTTTDIYQHSLPSAASQATEALGALVEAELSQLSSKLSSTESQ